jgi:hypothetical protein
LAVIVCCCAPPSDHDWKKIWPEATVCGDSTLITWADFLGTVRVNGATPPKLSTIMVAPARFEAKVMSTVFAVRVTFFVFVRPRLSDTVRNIS